MNQTHSVDVVFEAPSLMESVRITIGGGKSIPKYFGKRLRNKLSKQEHINVFVYDVFKDKKKLICRFTIQQINQQVILAQEEYNNNQVVFFDSFDEALDSVIRYVRNYVSNVTFLHYIFKK